MKQGPAEKVCNYRIKNHLISASAHKEAKLRLHGNILILTFSNLSICLCNIRDEINSTVFYEVFCTAENLQVAECGPTCWLTPIAWYHSVDGLSPPKQGELTKFIATEHSKSEWLSKKWMDCFYLFSTAAKKKFSFKRIYLEKGKWIWQEFDIA